MTAGLLIGVYLILDVLLEKKLKNNILPLSLLKTTFLAIVELIYYLYNFSIAMHRVKWFK